MMSEYHKKKQQLQEFIAQKSLLPGAGHHCCITIYPNEFSLAYTENSTDKLVLDYFATYPYDAAEGLKERLAAIVRQYHLKQASCSWILAPQDYQLIPTDALPVTANEFQAAIRWKIKDTLHFPLDDVVIDKFEIPQGKLSTLNKIMVVAAQYSYLQKMSEDIKAAGLRLNFIDIPELALRNIMALSEQENQSHALIYIQNATIQLLITHHKNLYFSRSLEFGLGGLNENEEELANRIDQLSGEIHRSFDYYEGQWRLPLPTSVTVASTKVTLAKTVDQLSQSLALPVQLLNLNDKLVTKQAMDSEQQGKYLPMIGEFFRKEYERDATTN